MSNNEVCIPAIKLTKERLLEERKIIDEKIKALDIVLEMFDDPEKAAIEKIITHKDTLSEEEKKAKKKKYMQDYFARKKAKNPDAVALGRLGGLKGGKARNENLTSEEKTKIARKGAEARWGSKRSEEVEILRDNKSMQRQKEDGINYEDMA